MKISKPTARNEDLRLNQCFSSVGAEKKQTWKVDKWVGVFRPFSLAVISSDFDEMSDVPTTFDGNSWKIISGKKILLPWSSIRDIFFDRHSWSIRKTFPTFNPFFYCFALRLDLCCYSYCCTIIDDFLTCQVRARVISHYSDFDRPPWT